MHVPTVGSELDGIPEQVDEHLPEPLLVGEDLHPGQGGGIFNLDRFLRRHATNKEQACLAEFVDRHRRTMQIQLASFDPGDCRTKPCRSQGQSRCRRTNTQCRLEPVYNVNSLCSYPGEC